MLPKELYQAVKSLLTFDGYNTFLLEQTPSNESLKNYDGFICFDIEESDNYKHSEGLGYTETDNALVYNTQVMVIVYGRTVEIRDTIQELVNNKIQPKSSSKRRHLVGLTFSSLPSVYLRHLNVSSTSSFPVQKTGQSVTELAGTVTNLDCSFSIVED